MKFIKAFAPFLTLDSQHARVDLSASAAGLVALVAVVCWSANGALSAADYGWRLLAAGVFIGLAVWLLMRAGASRVSAMLVAALALALCSVFSARELWLVSIYATVLVCLQEYFLLKSKLAAIAAVVVPTVLLAGIGAQAKALLVLFGTGLVARVLWHAVFERVSRRVFVLFAAKVFVLAAVVPLLVYGLRHLWVYSFGLPAGLPTPEVQLWVAVIIVLVAIRGLWATILLKTERSPQFRGLRIFYLCLGAALLVVVATMHRYAAAIFLPTALQQVCSLGLAGYSIAISSYALLAVGLLLTAAVDRS
jgi:hypothetical protein